ncbi:MAG TPA: hypothetical protein VI279_13515 [Rhodocyclaceae bacterium]
MEAKDILTVSLSAFAVAVALISFFMNYRQKHYENKRNVRKSLTEAIAELVEISIERNKLDIDKDIPLTQLTNLRRLMNSKRRYLANHVEFLIPEIPELVTDIDYNVLAGAFEAIGDYDKSQQYWDACVDTSINPVIRMQNLRGSARFQFSLGNSQLGRRKYQESLEINLPDSDNLRRMRADTFAMWAQVELDYGYVDEAKRLKAQALGAAGSIGHGLMKEEIIQRIEHDLQFSA